MSIKVPNSEFYHSNSSIFPSFPMQANSTLQEKTAQIDSWNGRYDQAVQFLMNCLEDIKGNIVTLEHADNGFRGDNMFGRDYESGLSDVTVLNGRLEDLSPEQRGRVLEHLLDRLSVFTKTQQLEAVSTPTGTHMRDGGISLPQIPPYPRRGVSNNLPISQTVVATSISGTLQAGEGEMLSPKFSGKAGKQFQAGSLRASVSPGKSSEGKLSAVLENGQEAGGIDIPSVEDLLAKVGICYS